MDTLGLAIMGETSLIGTLIYIFMLISIFLVMKKILNQKMQSHANGQLCDYLFLFKQLWNL